MQRILVVDDEAEYRLHLRERLAADGFLVRVAAEGDAAVRAGWLFAPDLLIVDQVLRGRLDGASVARELRRQRASLPVILRTGYSSESRAPGPWSAVIEKPFRYRALRDTVRRILGQPRWSVAME